MTPSSGSRKKPPVALTGVDSSLPVVDGGVETVLADVLSGGVAGKAK